MPNSTEDEVIRKLRERTARGELAGIDVVYHVNGGSPVEQEVDEEIQLSGRGEVRARARTPAATMREASETVPLAQLTEILQQIGESAGDLIPRSEARFIPDSVVGQVSVTVDDQEVSLFFLADQGQAKQHGKVLSPRAAAAVDSLARLHKQILQL